MFPSLIRRAAQQGVGRNIPYIYTNTFKAKRAWPPDFEKIPTKLQFRLERKYKRRSKLKWARPKWVKAVKMVQYGSVLFVMIYGVLFLDWNTGNMGNPEHPPFQGVRDWFFGLTGGLLGDGQIQRRREPDDASPTSDTRG